MKGVRLKSANISCAPISFQNNCWGWRSVFGDSFLWRLRSAAEECEARCCCCCSPLFCGFCFEVSLTRRGCPHFLRFIQIFLFIFYSLFISLSFSRTGANAGATGGEEGVVLSSIILYYIYNIILYITQSWRVTGPASWCYQWKRKFLKVETDSKLSENNIVSCEIGSVGHYIQWARLDTWTTSE